MSVFASYGFAGIVFFLGSDLFFFCLYCERRRFCPTRKKAVDAPVRSICLLTFAENILGEIRADFVC